MTTKLHAIISAEGHFIEGMLTGGQVHDVVVAEDLLADIVGCHILLDAGYDSDPLRRAIVGGNNIPVIPGRKNRKIPVQYDKNLYKLRRNIEIFFGKIKENKRLVAKFDKLDQTFLAFIALAVFKTILKDIIS